MKWWFFINPAIISDISAQLQVEADITEVIVLKNITENPGLGGFFNIELTEIIQILSIIDI